jgi:hypothetical protein
MAVVSAEISSHACTGAGRFSSSFYFGALGGAESERAPTVVADTLYSLVFCLAPDPDGIDPGDALAAKFDPDLCWPIESLRIMSPPEMEAPNAALHGAAERVRDAGFPA